MNKEKLKIRVTYGDESDSYYSLISEIIVNPRFFEASTESKRLIIDESIETLKEDLKCKLTRD